MSHLATTRNRHSMIRPMEITKYPEEITDFAVDQEGIEKDGIHIFSFEFY